ncbi:hypothetical protein STHU_01670 [Allostella humosa]|nr:hypothetical protein STHU_01670 [Stella humosa]
MAAAPLVSIVIPVFNGANYLAEAIESALGQTYRDIEVLVVDDGSTDQGATRRVAAAFGSRIRYLAKPNGGVGSALNFGIAAMRGELFSWLSHDDLYRPRKVERQVAAWRSAGRRAVVVGDVETMDAEGTTVGYRSLAGTNLAARPLDAIMRRDLNGCAMLIPRAVFDEVGLFDPGLPTTQDYDLWLRMAHRVPFVHVAAPDVRQRLHPEQGSHHPAHRREAERLFVHAFSHLPPARMAAYEGSEVGFLLRHRDDMAPYPGVVDHIDRRLADLRDQADLACVLMAPDGMAPPAAAAAAVQGWNPRPRQVLHGGFGAAAVRRAVEDTTAEWLLFVRADRLPAADRVRAALVLQARRDADMVLLAEPAGDGIPVADFLLRRGAALALRIALVDAATLDRACLDALALVATLPGQDPPETVPGRADIRDAAAGQSLSAPHGADADAAVVRALADAGGPELPRILFLAHDFGGGTLVHLQRLGALLRGRAVPVFAFGSAAGEIRLSLSAAEGRHGVVFRLSHHYRRLVDTLRRAGFVRVDVFHVMGFEEHAAQLVADLGLPYDVTLVDYDHFATPPHLGDADGRFRGEGLVDAREPTLIRASPRPIVTTAGRVVAISRDMAHRVARIAPGLPLVCAAHWARPAPESHRVMPVGLRPGEPLRVLLVGTIGPIKGSQVVAEAARIVRTRRLPIRFHVAGALGPLPALPDDVLTIHPAADHGRLPDLFGHIGAHVGWHPAQVPETWSYSLTDMMEAGLPIVASALGALSERCAGRPFTWLLPWDGTAEAWVEFFLRLHATRLAEPPRWAPVEHLPPAVAFYPDAYLAPAEAALRERG